ncbi:helix-turn-helix domain-containing protein [Amycolatopsis palatopharyngis]|uniref:helix-turn-helix domain-containing protein n=1 Tax=Amycolatopsis palatopharyngis TaxID=187982 RepID=UPI0013BE95A7|nr:helix-turn-helix transcriptional regulator [Amycolatopsis palatopharyngis]
MTTNPLGQPEYGKLLRQRREERDLSLSELGALVRMAPGYLGNIERANDPKPSTRKQRQLAKALDCLELGPSAGATYPDPPPKQPSKGPSGPTRRQEKESDRKGPKRVQGTAA